MKSNTYHVFFSKLSNPLRIKIITSLYEKPKSVNELIKDLKVEQSKLSHALMELKECSIVGFRREGRQRIYSLSKSIFPILRLIECHSENCAKCRGCKN